MIQEMNFEIKEIFSVNPRDISFIEIDGIWEAEGLVNKQVNKIYYEDLYNKDGVVVSKQEIDTDISNEEEISILKYVYFSDTSFGSKNPTLVQIDYDFYLLPMGGFFIQTNIMTYIKVLNNSFKNDSKTFNVVHHDKHYNQYSELASFGSKTNKWVIDYLKSSFDKRHMNGLYEISCMGIFSVSIAHTPRIEFDKKQYSSNKEKAIKKYPEWEEKIKYLYAVNVELYNLYKKLK
jgi:hypothetical protein